MELCSLGTADIEITPIIMGTEKLTFILIWKTWSSGPPARRSYGSESKVRVNWACLEITPNGVLEYWSIGVLVLKTKKR